MPTREKKIQFGKWSRRDWNEIRYKVRKQWQKEECVDSIKIKHKVALLGY
ncbi:MAG: hypothetical protein AABY15_03755 [Nanoarchaeota archaeon]